MRAFWAATRRALSANTAWRRAPSPALVYDLPCLACHREKASAGLACSRGEGGGGGGGAAAAAGKRVRRRGGGRAGQASGCQRRATPAAQPSNPACQTLQPAAAGPARLWWEGGRSLTGGGGLPKRTRQSAPPPDRSPAGCAGPHPPGGRSRRGPGAALLLRLHREPWRVGCCCACGNESSTLASELLDCLAGVWCSTSRVPTRSTAFTPFFNLFLPSNAGVVFTGSVQRAAMRPQVSQDSACHLAMRHWAFAGPLACVELAGYDDRNLRLTGAGRGPAVPGASRHHNS